MPELLRQTEGVVTLDPFHGITIKIVEHKYLPPGTILVSSDIAQLLRENYTVEGQDRALLKRMGISLEDRDGADNDGQSGTPGVGEEAGS